MKILHLSDTHGLHYRIKYMPEADVIVHSGDISNNGTEEEGHLSPGPGPSDRFYL